MPRSDVPVSRRAVLRALALLAGATALPSCATDVADARLSLATGATAGGYFALGTALAKAWQRDLRLTEAPQVWPTKGSLDNLNMLAAGTSNVIFCQLDVAAASATCCTPADPQSPRALARIYDDVLHVVTAADSPIRTLTDLRGARVSIGDRESGVHFVTLRVLATAGLAPERDLRSVELGIADSAEALVAGELDAFFWSGSLPTAGITALAERLPIRLLDLTEVVKQLRSGHPEYGLGVVPAGSYHIPDPVTTLLLRNVLLVQAAMADTLAAALLTVLFSAQTELTRASRAALTIDPRAAIGTQPVPLHPGAVGFYRSKVNS